MHKHKEQDAFQQFLSQRQLLENLNELSLDLGCTEVDIGERPILTTQGEDLDKLPEARIHDLLAEESFLFVDSLLVQIKQNPQNRQQALQQLQEVLGYLVNEHKHEMLVCKPFHTPLRQLFAMFQQLTDAAHSHQRELGEKAEQLDQLAILQREVEDLESQNQFLGTFRDQFMLSEDEIKSLKKQVYTMEQEKNKLILLLEEGEHLRKKHDLLLL